MKYISTRGGISPVNFKEAILMGLATDGGLLVPESIPTLSDAVIDSWSELEYKELALEVMSLFIDDIPSGKLKELIDNSYSAFSHPDITPVIKHETVHILELFHGPTLAFKDVALQLLGNLFEYLLDESKAVMNILGATSGDTGSAAIHGVRGKNRINIFIIHPHKKVSLIQELQMTSVVDDNVFNIAIDGTFDDGQALVKSIFNDIDYKNKFKLGAINSINWARILAQVVYYVYAYFKVCRDQNCSQVDFSIPTGNFGDIFAGYIARKLLTPERINTLVLATNDNDILSRFVNNGDYSTAKVRQTLSPSMDIQLASNFERYLFYLNDQDAEQTKKQMETFNTQKKLTFDERYQLRIRKDFASSNISEQEVIKTISDYYEKYSYVLDPHTAVGVKAGLDHKSKRPMVCLSTAHPGKFGEAVSKAIGEQELPTSLADLQGKPTKCKVLPSETSAVKEFLANNAKF